MLEATNIIHHAVFAVSVHEVASEIRQQIFNSNFVGVQAVVCILALASTLDLRKIDLMLISAKD